MKRNQQGFIEEVAVLIVAALILFVVFFVPLFVRFKLSNEVVSGVVYNTTNERFLSNGTCFSVRAEVNTYVSEENRSSYCIPGNSPYKELVNKAAKDKRIKVEVEASKYFTVKLPWTVYPNVKVTEIK